jgi:prepilin-type N-terminal cleavage/methylation domain-containing protein
MFFGYTIDEEGYFENRYGLAAGASHLFDDTGELKGTKPIRRGCMNLQQLNHSVTRARGITLVEILLVISVLAIVAAFALPAADTAAARAELKAAAENLEYSVGTARNVARLTESSISLDIESSPVDEPQTIAFSYPGKKPGKRGPDIQPYRLPEGVELISDRDRFVFDPRGMVEQPGRILLVSRADKELTSALDIN